MKRIHTEPVARSYIRLLKVAAEKSSKCNPDLDTVLLWELMQQGAIEGAHDTDAAGVPFVASVTGITFKGRLLLASFEHEQQAATITGWLWRRAGVIAGVVMGSLATMLPGLLKFAAHWAAGVFGS